MKAKTSVPVISQSFRSILMEYGILFRLATVMNLRLILPCPFNVQGRKPYLYMISFEKNINVRLFSDIYRLISFKLCMMIETTEQYILISVLVALTFIQGHRCLRN